MRKPTLKHYRRSIQIGTAIAFIIIPWLNHLHISFVYGNFLSFHFIRFPLADPLAVLQISLKNGYLNWDLIIGAGIALLLAAALGTVFCSWLCPYGLLSEWSHTLAQRMAGSKYPKKRRRRQRAFRVKLILFGAGLTAFLIFSTTPVLNQLSLPAWYSRIFQFWFEQWHFSLAVLALLALLAAEIFVGKRFWCRNICPQSVLIALAKVSNPRRLKVDFDAKTCDCRDQPLASCVRSCSLGLNPKRLHRFPETDCTNCGDCVVACQKRGKALTFRFGKTDKGTDDKR